MIKEHDIIQNVGIGAFALHKFTCSYFAAKQNTSGPSLAVTMPVLPILFHKKTLAAIYRRNMEGGLFNALSDCRELPVGLQERIENMSEQTFKSINVAFSSGLITYDREMAQLFPVDKQVKVGQYNSDIKTIIKGADRLGYWFAGISFEQLCILLKINF